MTPPVETPITAQNIKLFNPNMAANPRLMNTLDIGSERTNSQKRADANNSVYLKTISHPNNMKYKLMRKILEEKSMDEIH